MPWCASVSSRSRHRTSLAIDSKDRTSAWVWLNHVGRHQMHPVQQVVNKGVQIREPQGRICGSVVRRMVMSCIVEMQGCQPTSLSPLSEQDG